MARKKSKKSQTPQPSKLFMQTAKNLLPAPGKTTPGNYGKPPYKPLPPLKKRTTYVTRCRRLDWHSETETWENWTDYDVVCGLLTASEYEQSNLYTSGFGSTSIVKAKPFAGQKERFEVEDAYDAGKTTVVATPETHPCFPFGERPENCPPGFDRSWGGPQQNFTEVIRITELDEVGAEEHYYYLVSKGSVWSGQSYGGQQGNLWSGYGSYSHGSSVTELKNGKAVSSYDDGPAANEKCLLCGRILYDCRCSLDELNDAKVCYSCNGSFSFNAPVGAKICYCTDTEHGRKSLVDPADFAISKVGSDHEYLRDPDGNDDFSDLDDADLTMIGEDLQSDGELPEDLSADELIDRVKRWLHGEDFS